MVDHRAFGMTCCAGRIVDPDRLPFVLDVGCEIGVRRRFARKQEYPIPGIGLPVGEHRQRYADAAGRPFRDRPADLVGGHNPAFGVAEDIGDAFHVKPGVDRVRRFLLFFIREEDLELWRMP